MDSSLAEASRSLPPADGDCGVVKGVLSMGLDRLDVLVGEELSPKSSRRASRISSGFKKPIEAFQIISAPKLAIETPDRSRVLGDGGAGARSTGS